MTGVAKGLITKFQRIANNTVKNLIMNAIGYEQGRKIGTQDNKTKFWMFVLSTGLPVVTGSLGVLPKFFYPLNSKLRDQMYEELIARRQNLSNAVTDASAEKLAELGKKQMAGDFDDMK